MIDPSLLAAAGLAGFVYAVSPGPGVLAVLGIGADRGRGAGAAFLLGHLAGDVLWSALALVAIIGVTAVGSLVFDALGVASGLYLAWLGLRAVRTRATSAGGPPPVRRPVVHGLVFGATNPKAYPVAVATFTALLSAKAGLLTWAMLPALLAASTLGGVLGYAMIIAIVGLAAVRRTYRRHAVAITRVSGVVFLGFSAHALYHGVPGLLAPRRP